ncbi:MAG: sporulation protein YunB [Caldicoprobacterales bacterium]|nr:sporulation protein YunB [Clostridiales bacterium]
MRRFKSLRLAKISALGVVAIVAGLFLLIFLFIDHNINPAIISFSQAKIQAIAINSLSDAVKKTLGTNIKYTDFVNVLTDKNGNVAMLQANTMKMNDLAAQVSDMAQETIRSKGDEGIDIPLGTITGSKLLAGMGPKIRIRIISFPAVSTDFDSELVSSGINQTRHKIYLTLRARIRIAIPLNTADIDVESRVPVTETIIVGDVPQTYVNVDDTDKMLNLVPLD